MSQEVSGTEGAPADPENAGTAEQIKKRFVGNWRLVSYVIYNAAGHATRREMAGGLMYDDQGRMSAQLLRFGHANTQGKSGTSVYLAYFGDFELDVEHRRVIHHVKGSSRPMWIGEDLIREYRFGEDRLTLSLRENGRVTTELTWQREK